MDLELIGQFIPEFGEGIVLTLELLVISLFFGFALAMVLALFKKSTNLVLNYSSRAFIYFFRGTPFLVQIYLIYYGLGQFEAIREVQWLWFFLEKPFFCALLALIINNAAYAAEIIHNAIVTTDKGEIEAARAYGMSHWQSMRYIVIPSALRRAIPAYTNEIIFMLHATSLVSVITLLDITGIARKLYSRFYAPFEAFITAALFYLLLSILINFVAHRLEKRFNRYLKVNQ